jgi:hypothetical protein
MGIAIPHILRVAPEHSATSASAAGDTTTCFSAALAIATVVGFE